MGSRFMPPTVTFSNNFWKTSPTSETTNTVVLPKTVRGFCSRYSTPFRKSGRSIVSVFGYRPSAMLMVSRIVTRQGCIHT